MVKWDICKCKDRHTQLIQQKGTLDSRGLLQNALQNKSRA